MTPPAEERGGGCTHNQPPLSVAVDNLTYYT